MIKLTLQQKIINYIGNKFELPENYHLIKYKRNCTDAKKIAITLIMDNTDLTLWEIANLFELRAHSAVIDAHNVVDDRIFIDRNYKSMYNEILSDLGLKYKVYEVRTANNKI